MKVRIITDSSAELEKDYAAKNNIKIMPIEVIFNDGNYFDGEDIAKDEFYEKLINNKELPKTSLINESRWVETFNECQSDANTLFVVMPISKELSGSHNAARMALNSINNPENIVLIDTNNVTFALGALIMETVKLAKTTKTKEELVDGINNLITKLTLLAYIDELKYLKYGGRLSSTAAAVGGMLKIKPIVTLSEGKVFLIHKALGIQKASTYIISRTVSERDERYPIYFGYAYKKSELEDFKRKYCSPLNLTGNESTLAIGPTVGTHVGPGAVGLIFFKK